MAAIATLNTAKKMRSDGREQYIVNVVAVAPGSNSTFDVVLPTGHYFLSLAIKEAVTGTTTDATIQRLIKPQDASASVVSTVDLPFYLSTGVILTTLAIDTITNDIVQILPSSDLLNAGVPVALSGGLRVTLVNGTAVAAETMELTLIATQVG